MALNRNIVRRVAQEALLEDAAHRDITTLAFIPKNILVEAKFIAKEDGVVCGVFVAREVFGIFDKTVSFTILKKEGGRVKKGDVIAKVRGRARSVLSCERVALNFISYLSGISTVTDKAVGCVSSRGIRILDTRKTTPLLRAFEKYAVLVGGGKNHRLDLSEQYLVKDNHICVLRKAKKLAGLAFRENDVLFEIEVDNLDGLKKSLALCPDIIMLDNFKPQDIRKAIAYLRKIYSSGDKRPLIELSGGISLENIRQYAIKGVDFISLGALTHSARALDISLEITKVHSR